MTVLAPVVEPGDAGQDEPVLAVSTDAPDPAASVVAIGEVPTLQAPVLPSKKLNSPMPSDVGRGWLVTVVLALIAVMVRFWQLGYRTNGGAPIFDEAYYALHAFQVLTNGGYEDNYAYPVIVHPPLGKQVIAIGEWLFGYNAFGWRFATAVAGVICVILVVRVTRRLARSTMVGGIAGILLICDGVSHVQSRTGLLDMIQAVFVLAGFACIVADRDLMRNRLAAAVADGTIALNKYGPRVGARWWRFAAGVLFGCSIGVKWSGIYWVAAFGIITVIWDITARRAAGVSRSTTAVARRDLLPAIWSMAIVPIVVYVASWWAWFASETAWARHLDPSVLKSWWDWQKQMLTFHNGLQTPLKVAERHPWESKPWSWPMSTRPVLYYISDGANATGCDGATDCYKRIFLVGTPAMWWLALPVLFWALWRIIGRLDWRYLAPVAAYAAGYLPWFFNLERQMYFFYMTPVAPFLIITIALICGDVLGQPRRGIERRLLTLGAVCLYVALVIANFAFMWPILNGDPLTNAELTSRIWLPTWG